MVVFSCSSFERSHSRLRIRHKGSLSLSIYGATLYPDLVRAMAEHSSAQSDPSRHDRTISLDPSPIVGGNGPSNFA